MLTIRTSYSCCKDSRTVRPRGKKPLPHIVRAGCLSFEHARSRTLFLFRYYATRRRRTSGNCPSELPNLGVLVLHVSPSEMDLQLFLPGRQLRSLFQTTRAERCGTSRPNPTAFDPSLRDRGGPWTFHAKPSDDAFSLRESLCIGFSFLLGRAGQGIVS